MTSALTTSLISKIEAALDKDLTAMVSTSFVSKPVNVTSVVPLIEMSNLSFPSFPSNTSPKPSVSCVATKVSLSAVATRLSAKGVALNVIPSALGV